MGGKKILGAIIEFVLLFVIVIVGIKVYSGNPSDASYNSYVMNPFVFVYLGLYAVKTFANRSTSNLKYLFYAAFGALILGIRFYVNIDGMVSSIKYIALGAVTILVVYHVIEIAKIFKSDKAIGDQ